MASKARLVGRLRCSRPSSLPRWASSSGPTRPKPEPRWTRLGREARSVAVHCLAIFPVLYIVWEHGFAVLTIRGMSMQPTFNPDSSKRWRDVVIVSRLARRTGNFKRGEVVTFWHPADPRDLVVKRIIALEGDIVKTIHPCPDKYVRVPPGHCWVEGDESFHSRDSNAFGPLPLGLVDGRVEKIILPISRYGDVPSIYGKEARVRRIDRQMH